jgi:hypothetical protein
MRPTYCDVCHTGSWIFVLHICYASYILRCLSYRLTNFCSTYLLRILHTTKFVFYDFFRYFADSPNDFSPKGFSPKGFFPKGIFPQKWDPTFLGPFFRHKLGLGPSLAYRRCQLWSTLLGPLFRHKLGLGPSLAYCRCQLWFAGPFGEKTWNLFPPTKPTFYLKGSRL